MIWLRLNRRKKADRLLATGRTAEAIRLYRKAKAWDALMAAYEQQGDLQAAAEAGENGGMYAEAAALLESAHDFRRSAELWLRVPCKERAALAFEQGQDYEPAARLYQEAGMPARAADALAMLDRHADAAKLYEQAQQPANALRMYYAAGLHVEAARVLEASAKFEEAARLRYEGGDKASAADLFRRAHQPFEAARCYAELGDYVRAGDTLEEAGHPIAAAEHYEKDPASLQRSAQVFRQALISTSAWRRKPNFPISCLGMSAFGHYIAVGYAAREAHLFKHSGAPAWRFKPPFGGRPLCVALSHDGLVALGCDDQRLYLLENDKKLVWAHELAEEPVKVCVDASSDRILCCTKGNIVHLLDKEGTVLWEYPVGQIVCGLALSSNGKVVAIGAADGVCIFLTDEGKRAGEYKASEWVDSVSLSADGAFCAMGIGMDGVELFDVNKSATLWSARNRSPVHNAVLTPYSAVLSVADDGAQLRNTAGTVIWRYVAEKRLLDGYIDGMHKSAVFRNESNELICLNIQHCVGRAAANYEKAGDLKEAGTMYESMQNHARAAEVFRLAGDFHNAARNVEMAGAHLEAASLYELAHDFETAAHLFEAEGKPENAAECYLRAEQPGKAAELFEQVNRIADAAGLFEQAGQHRKAGDLYKSLGHVQAAIHAYTEHLQQHPNETEYRLQLGLLLQEDGQYDEAIGQLQKVAREEAHRKVALLHLAECFVSKNLYDIAIDRYQACLKAGEKISWDTLDVHYGLARAYHLAGNYAPAKQVYETVLAIDYQFKDARERLNEVAELVSAFSTSHGATDLTHMRTVVMDSGFMALSSDTKERYTLKRQLGKGGMGTVFLAEDARLKRDVALKILPPHMAADQSFRLRMIREAQVVAQLSHPNIVRIFDVGEENGRCYIIMEYVEGQTVREMLADKWEPGQCVQLLLQVTEGMADAHRKGITHRDIKPENIIITPDGTAKIMDFGLALTQDAPRLTAAYGVCGTYWYMAPEQVRGERDVSAAADVYAVGCMAYEILSGTPPFTGDDIGIQHLTIPPKPLTTVRQDTPERLAAIIMKCLEKKPPARYPDASALNAALQAINASE